MPPDLFLRFLKTDPKKFWSYGSKSAQNPKFTFSMQKSKNFVFGSFFWFFSKNRLFLAKTSVRTAVENFSKKKVFKIFSRPNVFRGAIIPPRVHVWTFFWGHIFRPQKKRERYIALFWGPPPLHVGPPYKPPKTLYIILFFLYILNYVVYCVNNMIYVKSCCLY